MNENIPKFLTIRETAKTGILSEHHLRIMEKQGRLPGVRVGNRFKVNLDLLVEQLNQESTPAQHEEQGNGRYKTKAPKLVQTEA